MLGMSPEELEKIKEQFPYFNAARLQLLRNRHNAGDVSDKELSGSAVYSGDRRTLYDFLKKKNRSESAPVVQEVAKSIEEDIYIIPMVDTTTPIEEVAEPIHPGGVR